MSLINADDVQGNVLKGYGQTFDCARHFMLGISHGGAARGFVRVLVDGSGGDGLAVTSGARWPQGKKPMSCLNVGFTWRGLKALGVPDEVLATFPVAFREGPAVRARTSVDGQRGVGLGDVRESDPEQWTMGGPRNPDVHLVVSVHAQGKERLTDVSARLRDAFVLRGLREQSHHDAATLSKSGMVHFGYRDGIAQPRIAGGHGKQLEDMQPELPTGDLLLGCDYVNSFHGNYAGDLPAALADNATYGAFRILYQDVAAFERLLWNWGRSAGIHPKYVAAKLMGRWQNGVPLVLSPDTDEPEPRLPESALNAFDYVARDGGPGGLDDSDGVRCPIGAHTRRLNPRGALVMGVRHSRRLVRRSMPYGRELEEGAPDDGVDRGIVGYFLCGDLEAQWEAVQRIYANEGIATYGIRDTREPIGGTQPDDGGRFTIPTPDGDEDIKLDGLSTLVHTRGSVYCLLPGIGGLRHLAALPADPEPGA
jgi:deferrochelatase/peroxidase EfeB